MAVETLPTTVEQQAVATTVVSAGEKIRRFLQNKKEEFEDNLVAWQLYESIIQAKAQGIYEETEDPYAKKNWYEAERLLALSLDPEMIRKAKEWKKFQDELTALAKRFREDDVPITWAIYKMLGWKIDCNSGHPIL